MQKIVAGLVCVFISILLLGTGSFASDKATKVTTQIKSLNKITSGSEAPALQSNPTDERGLGDLGKPPDYDQTIKRFRKLIPGFDMYADTVLPGSWTGQYTTAKDQGYCGSCWAFAAVGTMESKILIAGGSTYDLSEQEQISCNHCNDGCCGGYSSSLKFWYAQGPMQESCGTYGEYYWPTDCSTDPIPPYSVYCSSLSSCSRLRYYTTGYYTVDTSDPAEIKTSLYNDGPTYFRFDVYDDFSKIGSSNDWWENAGPGDVYTNSSSSTYRGGHAVLLVGWSETKSAWLCKNSWGATGGPNGDGTFWIAYSGHSHDLKFGMANVQLATTSSVQSLWYQPNDEPGIGIPSTYDTDGTIDETYCADDFTNTVPWSINTIFTEGFVSDDSYLYSLASAAINLSWYIYPDSSGVPAGYPGDGSGTEIWSHTCTPSAPEVTIGGTYGGDVTLDVVTAKGSPLNLEPGTYWLCFYPSISYSNYGRYYWFVSCSENPQPGHLIIPDGTEYTAWTSWLTIYSNPSLYDASFCLEGTAEGGGLNPGMLLLLLGD
jgi:hypothetical protein